jgi:DNA polymerase-3 subunit alpha
MAAPGSFVHLHCHTHYSLLDGASRIPELVQHVKSLGMTAVAITDHGNLYGAIEFYRECNTAGINPIIGYEAYVAPGKRTERESKKRGDAGFHLTLLAQNATGFKNLIKLASYAFTEGYYYVPRIDKELLEQYKEGLICLSGCASSEFSEFILRDQLDEAKKLAESFARLFGKNFYVEIQANGLEIQRLCAEGAIEVANKLGLPLVATSDAHYLKQEDAPAHDVLLCINTKAKRSDIKRMRYGNGDGMMVDQFFVRGPKEMYALFPGHAEAVQRSQEIADGVDIKLDFKKRHFPVYTPPEGKTPEQYLRELCAKGLVERYGENPTQQVRDRLEHELGIICRMGFASYFLIVGDFVRFAEEHGIPTTARGSACGAMVSYVLKLSHVCPLEYDLLFERFLDPNRAEAPDIDIDFCQDRREEVIQYVREKYGADSVAQIATFGTLAARQAIKDVGRVLDIPLERVIQLTNMVPKTLNITLEESLEQSADLRQAYESDPDVHELLDIAMKLEGTNRNSGTHAAGVVIGAGPLVNYVPLMRPSRKDDTTGGSDSNSLTTQWVMGDLEKVGLLKMDFLGLRTLTLLDNCVRMIEKTRNIKIDLQALPLDDAETYLLLQRGDAKGVFQLESDGMRELLKRMKPDNIRDLIAILALYRPGPLEGGMVDSYVNCKHGRETPQYAHPVLKEILEETYGVFTYQEQCMRILNRLGGIELASAYACIKAISKKKTEIIDQRRGDFIKGAGERGLEHETAEEIFQLITKFGGYGFNKSHTAAYAKVGYQTAYLKTHFRPEFMAALLSSEVDDGNKRDILVEHIADARRLGVEVLPPNVNMSEADFSVQNGKIVFGLTAIKGCGRQAAEEVVRARQEQGRNFRDIFDFCERVDLKMCKAVSIEKLVKAGALDCFLLHRAQLLHALPRAIQAATERQDDRRRGQKSLFDAFAATETETQATPEPVGDVPPWSETEKLKFEKEVLDFYFSSHPLAHREKELRRFATHTVEQIKKIPANEEVLLGGMLTLVRYMNYKKARAGNTRYMRCKIEDITGTVECVMWANEYAQYKDEIADDRIVLAHGKVERNREEPSLVLDRIISIDQAAKEMAKTLNLLLRFDPERQGMARIDALGEILQRTPGPCPVQLVIRDPVGRRVVLRLSRQYAVNPQTFEQEALEGLLGAGSVKLT